MFKWNPSFEELQYYCAEGRSINSKNTINNYPQKQLWNKQKKKKAEKVQSFSINRHTVFCITSKILPSTVIMI
jgi:hypothetical protein